MPGGAQPVDLAADDPEGAADGTGLMAHRAYADASKVSKIAGSTHRTWARLPDRKLRVQQLIEPTTIGAASPGSTAMGRILWMG
jgi:hypothetical protein